ncbi:MAG: radical SAM protein [Lachnospiraceae bacterium]|jgi:uncharacterized protein
MIVCQKPDPAVRIALKQQEWKEGETYRWIRYSVTESVPEGTLCYNVLTKEMVLLTDEDSKSGNTGNTVRTEDIRPGDLTGDAFRYLAEHWFLVPDGCAEKELIEPLRGTAKLFGERSGRLSGYTILPTMECNARCYYCYEKGMEQPRMTEETALEIVEYIRRTASKKFSLRWFGGEPLCNAEMIDLITGKLSDREFTSSMVSNGYLFDEEMADRAVSQWHLKDIQITLDGTENTYNRVKHYQAAEGSAGESPFRRVIRNIHLLLQRGVRVTIRLNLGRKNGEDLASLIHFLGREYAGQENLKVYAALLFEFNTVPDLRTQLNGLNEAIEKSGLRKPDGYPGSFRRVRYHYCMADTRGSIMINPVGILGRCEHFCAEDCGNVRDGITGQALYDSWYEEDGETPVCGECPILPDCIRLTRCARTEAYHHQCPENGDIAGIKERCRKVMVRVWQKQEQDDSDE